MKIRSCFEGTNQLIIPEPNARVAQTIRLHLQLALVRRHPLHSISEQKGQNIIFIPFFLFPFFLFPTNISSKSQSNDCSMHIQSMKLIRYSNRN